MVLTVSLVKLTVIVFAIDVSIFPLPTNGMFTVRDADAENLKELLWVNELLKVIDLETWKVVRRGTLEALLSYISI